MIIKEVAPNPCIVVILVNLLATVGTMAITPSETAPINVILVKISSYLSAVGLPGLIPGIAEPYFFKLLAISLGCMLGIIEA